MKIGMCGVREFGLEIAELFGLHPDVEVTAVADLDAIVAAHPSETVLVVSHADVIKAALAHYAGLHLDLFQRLVVSPASLSVVAFTPMGPRIICLNDVAHVPEEENDTPS